MHKRLSSQLSVGLAITFSVAVGGQLFSATAVDHFGILGAPRRPTTQLRIVSLAIVTAGCILSVRMLYSYFVFKF